MVKVTFLPLGEVVEVPKESTILQAAVKAGVQIQSTCGGRGTCGKCKVQIPLGDLTSIPVESESPLSDAERSRGWVSSCKYTLQQDLTVNLNMQKDVYERKLALESITEINIEPRIHKYYVQVEQPSIANQAPDWERLLFALSNSKIGFNRSVAANLPETLRQANFRVTAVLDRDSLLAVEPGDTVGRKFGLAIDIGTTTVVVYLMDLNKGTVVTSGAATNLQHVFGADVISRISYASIGSDELSLIQSKVIDALNGIIVDLSEATGIGRLEIYQVVVVGNTTMSHLFLGIDPTYLATAPFIPVFRQSVEVKAEEIGLNILDTSNIVILPNIAGYVGSDTVGVMLAAGLDRLPGISLTIDIGTNGEIVLAGKERILVCSAAAGPAFEGAEIKCGMRAAQGAIEGVCIEEDVELEVISGGKARGICGSGLIDAIAQMRKIGVIRASGLLACETDKLEGVPQAVRERLRSDNQECEFVLAWGKETATGEDIVLSQKDIRKLQLAKGAIMAGIQLLLKEMDVTAEEIDRVLIAGAFGSYIKKQSAMGIRLLPQLPLERVVTIGNAAGDGAKMALLSQAERTRAEGLASRAEHIELSTMPEFQMTFMKALSL